MIWYKTEDKGVTVTAPTFEVLLNDLDDHLDSKCGFTVATLNLDHVVKLRRDQVFRTAYEAHTHVTADGNPIVWLSKLAGQGRVTLVPGSELIDPIAALAAQKNTKLAFLGSTKESLSQAAHALEARHPGLCVALTLAPPMGFEPTGPTADAAIAKIEECGAQIVFLALGAPKQEVFAAYAQKALNGVGFVSIGAGLDFISGTQTRAPKWARALAAEWLWRLLTNPRRLAARYGACLMVLPGLTLRAFRARRARSSL